MLGTIQINKLNLMQGALPEVERYMLFVGRGAGTNEGKVIAVNSQTDLDAVLGLEDSNLKRQLVAAQLNGKQNWNAAVLPLRENGDWRDAVDFATETDVFEGIALTDLVSESVEVERMQNKAEQLMARHMTPVFFTFAARGRLETETWSDHRAAIAPIVDVLADQVSPTVYLWGTELGTYAGRLCDRSVTVADSPIRTETGTLLGEWSVKPTDKDGMPIDMAALTALDKLRFSVPQWYPGPHMRGMYWGDGNVLDKTGGDYQEIENLRVIQKCMRQVYPLLVSRIGNRSLNEEPDSIAAHELFFARPLREMSKTRKILGIPFPGEIHPPAKDAIQLYWITKKKLEIWTKVRPYNCPKDITNNLALDLTNYAG